MVPLPCEWNTPVWSFSSAIPGIFIFTVQFFGLVIIIMVRISLVTPVFAPYRRFFFWLDTLYAPSFKTPLQTILYSCFFVLSQFVTKSNTFHRSFTVVSPQNRRRMIKPFIFIILYLFLNSFTHPNIAVNLLRLSK